MQYDYTYISNYKDSITKITSIYLGSYKDQYHVTTIPLHNSKNVIIYDYFLSFIRGNFECLKKVLKNKQVLFTEAKTEILDAIRDEYNVKMSDKGILVKYLKEAKKIHQEYKIISEEVAREVHENRNEIKEFYQDLTPALARLAIHQRNLKKYGNEVGPSYEFLINKGKDSEEIFYSSFKTDGKDLGLANNGFNEVLDLYNLINKAYGEAAKETGIYPESIVLDYGNNFSLEKVENFQNQKNIDEWIEVIEGDMCPFDLVEVLEISGIYPLF